MQLKMFEFWNTIIQRSSQRTEGNPTVLTNNRYGFPSQRTGKTVYPKKYAHGFVVLCFVVVMQSFIMNSHEVFIHIHQGCFAGTGAIVRLPQCQWSKPDGYGKISQCITTTKHSKAKTVCIFLGIYCTEIVPCHDDTTQAECWKRRINTWMKLVENMKTFPRDFPQC